MRGPVATATVCAAVLVLTGCTPTVSLQAAPQATAIQCAQVVVALRGTPLVGLPYRYTDAQGTLAWGRPAQVTLVCGQTPAEVPPSSRCVTIDGVEWAQTTARSGDATVDRYDTYGRHPDIAVFTTRLTVSPGAVLEQLASPINDALPRQDQRCG